MKRFLAVVLIGVMFASVFAGCGKKTSNETNEKEDEGFKPSLDTEMSAEFTIVGNLSNFEALEAVIFEFTKVYPNVKISYEKLDDYNNMIKKRLANDPTVGCYLGAFSDVGSVDLLKYDYDTSGFGAVINAGMKNGALYHIPLGVNVYGFMVNTTLLEKEGIAIPNTMSEFEAACDKLVAKGYTPIQQNPKLGCMYMFRSYVYSMVLNSNNKDALIKQLTSGSEGCTEPFRAVFDVYDKFVSKGYISPEENKGIKDGYDAAILNFFEGDVAFMPAISDTVTGMKKRESKSEAFGKNPFKYQFIYTPFGKDGVIAIQDKWECISVNENSENIELAVEFLKFLGTKENLDLLADTKGIPSASNGAGVGNFVGIHDAKGEHIYIWEGAVPFDIYNSTTARLGEYAGGKIATVDEALSLLSGDLKAQ